MSNQELVKRFEIKEVLPCITTPVYIRFTAQADREIGEVIPIVFLKFPPGKVSYNESENTLTLNAFNRMITLHPSGKVAVTNTKDIKVAQEILGEIKKIINLAYKDYLRFGKPSKREIQAAREISWMKIYNYLPKINCGKCGFQVCSAFAVSVLQGDARLSQCEPLSDPKYHKNLEALKKELGPFLLRMLGWKQKDDE
ncbi:MAG: hypothetical protein DRN90_07240 [Thermoproteota archaeon]|nr:MAG: hypothetical protein DRN90_07240 [Candidatus Korarchaeota archaeon]